MKIFRVSLFWATLFLIIPILSFSQNKNDKIKNSSKSTYDVSYLDYRVHDNGRFWNTVMNTGIIGNYFNYQYRDRFLTTPEYYFPRYSRIRHGFFTALWVGGVIDDDTLVSTALDVTASNMAGGFWYRYISEFWPDLYDFNYFEDKYTEYSEDYSYNIESLYKYTSTFNDTLTNIWMISYNPYDMRYHRLKLLRQVIVGHINMLRIL